MKKRWKSAKGENGEVDGPRKSVVASPPEKEKEGSEQGPEMR